MIKKIMVIACFFFLNHSLQAMSVNQTNQERQNNHEESILAAIFDKKENANIRFIVESVEISDVKEWEQHDARFLQYIHQSAPLSRYRHIKIIFYSKKKLDLEPPTDGHGCLELKEYLDTSTSKTYVFLSRFTVKTRFQRRGIGTAAITFFLELLDGSIKRAPIFTVFGSLLRNVHDLFYKLGFNFYIDTENTIVGASIKYNDFLYRKFVPFCAFMKRDPDTKKAEPFRW